MCIDFVGYWPRDAIHPENQYCGLGAGGKMNAAESGSVSGFERRFGAAGETRTGAAIVGDLPAVVVDLNGGDLEEEEEPTTTTEEPTSSTETEQIRNQMTDKSSAVSTFAVGSVTTFAVITASFN
jgi:hypothetical protein